ncbi:MAG TPA: efflux RND transporter periplasmic adaptor subunit [Longimicrobiales bacterium]|nr:efflux RND transporter periplasmic adaptor subunit [Longimicrobiales bacterium]
MLKKKKIWIPALVVVALGTWALVGRGKASEGGYRLTSVERGNVESVVTATGTLQATETVEVGTQVSGQISAIYVDFNDHVKKGRLIAQIDPTILEQEVQSSEASVEKAKADLDQAQRQLDRQKELFKTQVVTQSDLDQAQYSYDVAKSSYAQAEVNLERAKRNLAYADIRAPIDGVVVARNVDVGQTVAASFSAPVLFVIARDLSNMEILAAVDESDIGKIHDGQDVHFTVQAYPEQTFSGTVRQVRLQSTTTENVVNYGVVVSVRNPDGKLLPGMTATTDFIVDSAENVLKVQNVALRFRPTEAMLAQLKARREAERGSGAVADSGAAGSARAAAWQGRTRAEGAQAASGGQAAGGARIAGQRAGAGNHALLWYVDSDGKVNAVPVRMGLTDGQYTVVSGPPSLKAGLQVIVASVSGGGAAQAATNPFEQQRGGFRRPPGVF